MLVSFYMRCGITVACKCLEKLYEVCEKSMVFPCDILNFLQVSVIMFWKILFFKKIYRIFVLVVLQNFAFSLVNFSSTLFISTCNQILACGYTLFNYRICYYDFPKLSSRDFFFYCEPVGLFKEFSFHFSWLLWNFDAMKLDWIVQG